MPPPSDRRSQARTRSRREKESSSGSSRSVTRWRSPATSRYPARSSTRSLRTGESAGVSRSACSARTTACCAEPRAERAGRRCRDRVREALLGELRARAPGGAPAARRLRRRRRASGGERGGRVPATRTSPQRPGEDAPGGGGRRRVRPRPRRARPRARSRRRSRPAVDTRRSGSSASASISLRTRASSCATRVPSKSSTACGSGTSSVSAGAPLPAIVRPTSSEKSGLPSVVS